MDSETASGEHEGVRARLLKVLRLAQQGVGGERDNAEALLAKLLRKHSMTMADLEDVSGQSRAQVWFAAGDIDERTVLSQLALKLFGVERRLWQRSNSAELGVDVTPSEHAALIIAWEVYCAAFAEARQALVIGFCFKHGLYASDGAAAADTSDEARARAARALAMAEVLPVVEAPTKRVGGTTK